MESIYELIGRCIERDNRRYFEQLKDELGYREAIASDWEMMPRLKELFCECRGIAPQRLESRKYDRGAAFARQACIALLYLCYYPNALNHRIGTRPARSFKARIGELLNISLKKIGTKTTDALFAYGHCRMFRQTVDEMYEQVARRIGADAPGDGTLRERAGGVGPV